jgi:uncharacterized coiled-coil protein SlyX
MMILSLLLACVSEDVSNDAQCSTEEQDMFLTCIDAGCSASYTQNLSGQDACEVSGGGSVVSVEAGGECGFSSSGSCYVVCSCPEGVGIQFDMNVTSPDDTNTPSVDLSSIESALTNIENRVASAEGSIQEMLNSLQSMNADSDEKIASVNASIAEMNARLAALENTVTDQRTQIAEDKTTIATLYSNLSDAQNQISQLQTDVDALEVSVDSILDDIDELYNSIGLVVSEYTVDCNSNNIDSLNPDWWALYYPGPGWTYTTSFPTSGYTAFYYATNHDCVLAEGISEGDMPLIQVYQDQQMMVSDFFDYPYQYTWSDYWMLSSKDGGLWTSKSGSQNYHGPGIQYRYDASMGIIYTAPHYEYSSSSTSARNYHVVIIGNKSYSAPGVPDFSTRP